MDGQSSGMLKGRDVHMDLEIDFMDAVRGTSKQVQYARNELCDTCKGSRTKPNAQKLRCSKCDGSGLIVEDHG